MELAFNKAVELAAEFSMQQAAPLPSAKPADVARFQTLMSGGGLETAGPSPTASVSNGAPSAGKFGELGTRAVQFVNDVSMRREKLEVDHKKILATIDFNAPESVAVMMNQSIAFMNSSAETHFLSSIATSLEKDLKTLMQAQS